jgi:hypothetical protein
MRKHRFRSRMPPYLVAALLTGCVKPYLVANFETVYQPRTRVVALAPIANLSTEPEGAKAGQAIREAIYYELSRRQDTYTVTIQDIAETDRRINGAGFTDSAAALLPGPELCRIVGAEAVMRGSVTRYKKKGAAGQVLTAVLFGAATGSEVKADVAIYDGSDGRMIWQHNIEKVGGLFSSPDALRHDVGRTVAKKFPYKRKT